MTAPSLLDELEEVVRLAEKATPGPFVVDGYGDVTANGEDVARIASDGYSAYHDAHLFADAANFIRTHHAEIADMAKRLEAAERDAFKWQLLCADCDDAGEGNRAAINVVNDACRLGSGALERHYGQAARDGLDAAIAATQEGEG